MVLFQLEETDMYSKPILFSMSNKKGFTLIELLMIIAILGVLTTLSIKGFQENRQKTYNTQALVGSRNILNLSATDAPTPADPGTDEHDARTDGTIGYYNEFVVNWPVQTNVRYDASRKLWQFFMSHVGGDTGFYFWIPGDGCSEETDGSGNHSDTILQNEDYKDNSLGIGPYP